jgi:hypothetical protein
MTMEREKQLGIVLGVMCLMRASIVSASCAPGIATAQQLLASHDAVFVGRVVAIRKVAIPPETEDAPQGRIYPNEVTFEVTQAWKGVQQPRVVALDNLIFTSSVGVGYDFLVFASRVPSDPRLAIMGCGFTVLLAKASEEIRDLGPPEYVHPAVPANDGVHPTACAVRSAATSTGEFGARRG